MYSNGKTPTGEYGLELERGVVGYAERGAVKITLSAYSGSSTITGLLFLVEDSVRGDVVGTYERLPLGFSFLDSAYGCPGGNRVEAITLEGDSADIGRGATFSWLPSPTTSGYLTVKAVVKDNNGNVFVTNELELAQITTPEASANAAETQYGEEGQQITYDVSTFFSEPSGAKLTYSAEGFARGSGFTINPTTGVITGTVTSVDTAGRQPMRVTITATNPVQESASILVPFEFGKQKLVFETNYVPMKFVYLGEPLELDLEPYIQLPGGVGIDGVSWSVSDGARGYSAKDGYLVGVPSEADFQNTPINVKIDISTRQGHKGSITIEMSVQDLPIPDLTVAPGKNVNVDMKQYFNQGSEYTNWAFSIEGVIRYGDLSIDSTTGVLSGVPGETDIKLSPARYIINAYRFGQKAEKKFTFRVQGELDPPVMSGMPDSVSGSINSNLNFDFSKYVSSPKGYALSFRADPGFPSGSGISLSNGGFLTGRPNEVNEYNFNLIVTDFFGGQVSKNVRLQIYAQNTGPSATPGVDGQIFEAERDGFLQLDFSQYYSHDQGRTLKYEIAGLPVGTNLKMEGSTLSGSPNAKDASASPMKIVVTVSDGEMFKFDNFQIDIKSQPMVYFGNPLEPAKQSVSYSADLNTYFESPYGETLIFSVAGFPPGTGLSYQQNTKSISGTPTASDFSSSPIQLRVTVRAAGTSGGDEFTLPLEVGPDPYQPPVLVDQGVPNLVAKVDEYFMVDMNQYFRLEGEGQIEYTLNGLPTGTGLSFQFGTLQGVPNNQDVNRSPMNLNVKAANSVNQKSVTDSFTLTVRQQGAPQLKDDKPIPQQEPRIGEYYSQTFSTYFMHPRNLRMTYAARGLPFGTGLTFTSSGSLSGTPKEEDYGLTELMLQVNDTEGNQFETPVYFTVLEPFRPPEVMGSITLFLRTGIPFSESLQSYFYHPNGLNLTYEVTGLAVGTGIKIDRINGTLFGKPTDKDFEKKPYNAKVTVTDKKSQKATSDVSIEVGPREPPQSLTSLPLIFGTVNQDIFPIDLKPFFFHPGGENLIFSIKNLPEGSGVRVSKDGKITGKPTAADFVYQNVVPAVIAVNDTYKLGVEGQISLEILAPTDNKPPQQRQPLKANGIEEKPLKMMDLRKWFEDPEKNNFTVTMGGYGLQNSQIKVEDNFLVGTPSTADYENQPLTIPLVVTDIYGDSINADFTLNILKGNYAPMPKPEYPEELIGEEEKPLTPVRVTWSDEENDQFTLKASGFPGNTGIKFNALTGEISGIPTQEDAEASPFPLEISGIDAKGAEYTVVVRVNIIPKTVSPTATPTSAPTTKSPTQAPSFAPTLSPTTGSPTKTKAPTMTPTSITSSPSPAPTQTPTTAPSKSPTVSPTTANPTATPTPAPSLSPITGAPSKSPTFKPTFAPSWVTPSPTWGPTNHPSVSPTKTPSMSPTRKPTMSPTRPPSHISKSARTCQQLKWPVFVQPSGETVCASSIMSTGCPGSKSYRGAVALCAAVGARLCTNAELVGGVARNTGCNLDSRKVWSSNYCTRVESKGWKVYAVKVTQGGGAGGSECAPFDHVYDVRCCADVEESVETPLGDVIKNEFTDPFYRASSEGKEELGMLDVPRPPNAGLGGVERVDTVAMEVKAEVIIPPPAESRINGKCFRKVTKIVARETCASAGMRLCTGNELAEGKAKGSGCQLDSAMVWSSSSCATSRGFPGTLITVGSGGWEAPVQCVRSSARTALHGARCCPLSSAESARSNEITSASAGVDVINTSILGASKQKSCSELGWKVDQRMNICMLDKVLNGECSTQTSHSVAAATCSRQGARLCSAADVFMSNLGENSECGLHVKRIWTQTPCARGYMTVGGSKASLMSLSPKCEEKSSVRHFRCCSDGN